MAPPPPSRSENFRRDTLPGPSVTSPLGGWVALSYLLFLVSSVSNHRPLASPAPSAVLSPSSAPSSSLPSFAPCYIDLHTPSLVLLQRCPAPLPGLLSHFFLSSPLFPPPSSPSRPLQVYPSAPPICHPHAAITPPLPKPPCWMSLPLGPPVSRRRLVPPSPRPWPSMPPASTTLSMPVRAGMRQSGRHRAQSAPTFPSLCWGRG